jgi:hypothetical protein
MPDALLRVALTALLAAVQGMEPYNQRPADVTIMMSTSRGKYDGTYTASQLAQVCGEVPADRNFAGVLSFIVQFPDADAGEVRDVTFGSKTLVKGVTTTSSFQLNVSLKSPKIGAPEVYVLDTAQPKMTGIASLATVSPGSIELRVKGVNDRGETIDLRMVCKPRGPGR